MLGVTVTAFAKKALSYRGSCPEVFCKRGFLKNFPKFLGNTYDRVSFLITLQASGLQLY